jgi:DNA topoisomerase II
MIIKKELIVSGRKRLDIMNDLKTKGFTAFAKEEKEKSENEDTDENAETPEEEEKTPDGAYDYLLNVSHFKNFLI